MTDYITVKMTVSGTDYFMSTEGFQGSNYYSPFVASLPSIRISGNGWIRTQAGELALTNNPDDSSHPFSYSTGWNSLLTNPAQQFTTVINKGEPIGDKVAMWYGIAVLRGVNKNGLYFNLYEFANYTELNLNRSVGNYPVSTLTAGNPTVLTVDNREMGSDTASDFIAVGDYVTINNTFAPVQANINYLVKATSGNNISIDLDSTSASFSTPRVVTNTYDSGSGTQCILNKVLTVPYVSFGTGSTKREIPRNRYYVDGFYGAGYFTPYENWYPSTGLGSTTKIFIDGVDVSSSFGLVGKSYKRTDNAKYDGTITFKTVTSTKSVYDFCYEFYGNTNNTKAPNSDVAVISELCFEFSKEAYEEELLDFICKNTNYQFYLKFADASHSNPTLYLIDKANIPTATVLDENNIIFTSYEFKQPTYSVSSNFKTRSDSGSLTGDNYQFIVSDKKIAITNTDLVVGSDITVEQMHDSLGQQFNYLQAILDNQKKMNITVAVDSVKTDIMPGDNINFTKSVDKLTCDQCLVREIIYDLNRQRTTFIGDGTITLMETT